MINDFTADELTFYVQRFPDAETLVQVSYQNQLVWPENGDEFGMVDDCPYADLMLEDYNVVPY